MLRIASFNANSIRLRLNIILDWMKKHNADVVCIQETKVTDADFPLEEIRNAGLHCIFSGQKTFNGVAIISKEEPNNVIVGFGVGDLDIEARLISAEYNNIRIVNTYIPQGSDVSSEKFTKKIEWIKNLRDNYFNKYYKASDEIIWVGDFNIATEDIDVYDPESFKGCVCFTPEEKDILNYVKQWGFVDVFRKHHPKEEKLFTFWDYRIPNGFKRKLGWRLDHIWATESLASKSVSSWIDIEPRSMERPSDHTFIAADFEI